MPNVNDQSGANLGPKSVPAAKPTSPTNQRDVATEPGGAGGKADITPQVRTSANLDSKGDGVASENGPSPKKTGQKIKQLQNAQPNLQCLELPPLFSVVPAPSPANIFSKPVELALAAVNTSAASLCAGLVVCAAAAAHAYDLEPIKKERSRVPLVIRLAIVGRHRGRSAAIGAALEGAFEAQTLEMKAGEAAEAAREFKCASDRTRRRLLLTTVANAALLGLPEIAADFGVAPTTASIGMAPFVVRDVRPTTVQRAVNSARKGLIIVDDEKMPNQPRIGINYDGTTGQMVNRSSRGLPLETQDSCGSIRMRKSAICVIGHHTTADIMAMHKSSFYELASTMFLPDDLAEATGDPKAINEFSQLVARLRDLSTNDAGEPQSLKLHAEGKKAIESAGRKAQSEGASFLGPMLYFHMDLQNLIHRIAGLFHLIEHAADGRGPSLEIGQETAKRAVEFVEKVIVPAAKLVLHGASMHRDERNARRILSYAQNHASPQWPHLLRRDLVRSFQRTMPVSDIDDALAVLMNDGLLMKADGSGGAPGQSFTVHDEVFAPHLRLPDLVSDPRRS